MNIPSGLVADVLLQIFNSKIRLQNKDLEIEEGTINTIDNMLEKNMDLQKPGVRLLANRMNYTYWAKIMYLGGENLNDNEFLTSIQDMKKSMNMIVDKMMDLHNSRNNTEGMVKPDKNILKFFFFSSYDEFRALRGLIFKSQVPSRILGTPGKTPAKKTTSTAKQLQNLAKKLFAPSKSKSGTPGASGKNSGQGLKHTGLKTVKQIISRTENLIQAANLGNKSPEVRNELDTLLAVLMNRKEIRPQFRTNLMKKLF